MALSNPTQIVATDSTGKVTTSVFTYGPSTLAVQLHPVSYQIVASDSGASLTTLGATGTVNLTLPATAMGLSFQFVAQAAQVLTVTAPVTGSVKGPGTISGTVVTCTATTAANQYTTFRLSCYDGLTWTLNETQGTVAVA